MGRGGLRRGGLGGEGVSGLGVVGVWVIVGWKDGREGRKEGRKKEFVFCLLCLWGLLERNKGKLGEWVGKVWFHCLCCVVLCCVIFR